MIGSCGDPTDTGAAAASSRPTKKEPLLIGWQSKFFVGLEGSTNQKTLIPDDTNRLSQQPKCQESIVNEPTGTKRNETKRACTLSFVATKGITCVQGKGCETFRSQNTARILAIA